MVSEHSSNAFTGDQVSTPSGQWAQMSEEFPMDYALMRVALAKESTQREADERLASEVVNAINEQHESAVEQELEAETEVIIDEIPEVIAAADIDPQEILLQALEVMYAKMDIATYQSFDRDAYVARRDSSDARITNEIDQKIVDTYQPKPIRIIKGNLNKRQQSSQKIESLLALYDTTKDATLAFERTVRNVPSQLVAIVNELSAANPVAAGEPDEESRQYESHVQSNTETVIKSAYALGADIARLTAAQAEFTAAYDAFIRSTKYIEGIVKAINQVSDDGEYDEFDIVPEPVTSVPGSIKYDIDADDGPTEASSPVEGLLQGKSERFDDYKSLLGGVALAQPKLPGSSSPSKRKSVFTRNK
ncbi:MAG: hypothetical protein ABIR91_03525 [Candidatus Saccharimonadales bacterium]